MKGQRIFPSVILIGFGLYYFLQQSPLNTVFPIFGWPTMFIIIGAAFLIQAYGGRDYEFILPGTLFFGLGLHFHIAQQFSIQLDHIGVIILFISLGFFLRHQKAKSGLFYGWLFLILALLQLFYDSFLKWLGIIENKLMDFHSVWPIVLIIIGAYLFFFKRK